MDKKEKYINFIIEDLVSKTEIDYEQGKIKFPFFPLSFPLYYSPLLFPSFSSFSNYIKEKYGAHSEEIEIIWKLYKERIKDKINNG